LRVREYVVGSGGPGADDGDPPQAASRTANITSEPELAANCNAWRFSAAFAALVSDLPAGTNSMVNESPRNWAPILATFDFDSIMRQKRVHPAAMPYKTRLGVRAVRILFE